MLRYTSFPIKVLLVLLDFGLRRGILVQTSISRVQNATMSKPTPPGPPHQDISTSTAPKEPNGLASRSPNSDETPPARHQRRSATQQTPEPNLLLFGVGSSTSYSHSSSQATPHIIPPGKSYPAAGPLADPTPPPSPCPSTCALFVFLSINMGFFPSLSSCLNRISGFSLSPRHRS